MLRTLLAKDLRRAWRNPVPWLISLGVPFLITALIGMAFGPASDGGLGRIKLGLVDEDDSALTRMLRGGLNQEEAGKYLEPHFLTRAEALAQIDANKLAAVVIIPKGFTRDYLTARAPVKLELVKNPAESIHPAMVEEMTATLVTGLNAVARNLQADFPEWRNVFLDDNDTSLRAIGRLFESAGDRLDAARGYLPPLVTYEKTTLAQQKTDAMGGGAVRGIFAYLQLGMAAMFLLFMADHAVRDFYRELNTRTLARYRTLREGLLVFVTGKVVYAVAMVLLGAVVLLGGAALVFRFTWQNPAALLTLVLAYALFGAGLMGFVAALAGQERHADRVNNLLTMILAMAGGCMFPLEQLPAFVRDHLAAWMPTAWFVSASRGLQFGGGPAWPGAALKLAVLGGLLIVGTAALFRRRLAKGVR
ncbi:MAG TPA: ABC transporter permease [Opitutaceae bacterium]|nr:ABC transporter permease [Opitutaceae bacterium]